MSYAEMHDLSSDAAFLGRLTACAIEQAGTFVSDARADVAAMAREVLVSSGAGMATLARQAPEASGFADAASSAGSQLGITDAMLVTYVQGAWAGVAALHYNPDGTPKT